MNLSTRKNITINLQLLFIFINGTDGKIVALVTISIFPSRTRYRLSAFPKNTFVLSCAVANCGASWFFYASIFASIQIDVGMFSKKWTFVVTPNIVGWSIPIVGGSQDKKSTRTGGFLSCHFLGNCFYIVQIIYDFLY